MNNRIFRQKSIERVSSPEQLGDYMRVANPGIWIVLAAIIILLAGACVWGVFGRLDTKLMTVCVVKNGAAVCYIQENDIASVSLGQKVLAGGKTSAISAISKKPVQVTDDFDGYALHIGQLNTGDWVYEATFVSELEDGVYSTDITTDSVSPISFLFN